jgi:hypothetical protein
MGIETTRLDSPSERAGLMPDDYSAGPHILRSILLVSGISGCALWLASRAAAVDWLLLPAFLLVANGIEWAFHKNPMHRPMGPRILYKNHSLIHHRAFLHDSMPIHVVRELGLIMMPWYTMLLLFTLASPVALLAAWWRGAGAAGIFFFAAALYFVAYETLHALYHMPPALLRRIGLGGRLFAAMSAHHRHHHRIERMAHVNFNVTFPLMDWLFGTKEKATPIETAAVPVSPEPREARA